MKIDTEVTGFDEFESLLRSLPDLLQRRVYRQALSAAATPIVRLAKQKAPTEKIRRNIVKKLNKKGSALGDLTISIIARKAYNPVTNVGSRRVKPYGEKDVFYSVWYEFGKKGQPARPFMRPAFDEGKSAAIEAFRAMMKQRLEIEVAKQALKR
jgi:HK97 gp10 family phage protein